MSRIATICRFALLRCLGRVALGASKRSIGRRRVWPAPMWVSSRTPQPSTGVSLISTTPCERGRTRPSADRRICDTASRLQCNAGKGDDPQVVGRGIAGYRRRHFARSRIGQITERGLDDRRDSKVVNLGAQGRTVGDWAEDRLWVDLRDAADESCCQVSRIGLFLQKFGEVSFDFRIETIRRSIAAPSRGSVGCAGHAKDPLPTHKRSSRSDAATVWNYERCSAASLDRASGSSLNEVGWKSQVHGRHAATFDAGWARGTSREGRQIHGNAHRVTGCRWIFRFGRCRACASSTLGRRSAIWRHLSAGLIGKSKQHVHDEKRADGPMSGSDTGAAEDRARSGSVQQRDGLPAPRQGRAAGRAGDARDRARRLPADRDKRQRHDRPRRYSTCTPDKQCL